MTSKNSQIPLTNACVELIHFIITAMNEKEFISTILIEITKAFETINHNVMLRKLSQIVLSSNDITFLSSYLENREQTTYVNEEYSAIEINLMDVL